MNVLKNLISIGGSWWKCRACGQTVQAACACCEPYHVCSKAEIKR